MIIRSNEDESHYWPNSLPWLRLQHKPFPGTIYAFVLRLPRDEPPYVSLTARIHEASGDIANLTMWLDHESLVAIRDKCNDILAKMEECDAG